MESVNRFMRKLNEFMSQETTNLMSGIMSELNVKMPTGSQQAFDPYQVLGLTKDCTDADIKVRYREIMKTIHPDVTGGKTNFLASIVNAAYTLICQQRGMNSQR